MGSQVLLLGLDGATFDLIHPWAQSGKLPHFTRLLREGSSGPLRSTVPPMSPPAWNSFITGQNPGKHGIFDFTGREPKSYETRFVNATWRQTPALWQYLSDVGKRVAVLSVPFTYPPDTVNGVMISGMDAPGIAGMADRTSMHPPGLCETLQAQFGPYPMGANLFAYRDPIDILNASLRTMEQKAKVALHLYEREDWDCFVFVLGETDATGHRLWRFCDPSSPLREAKPRNDETANALLHVYQKADAIIGQFLALTTPNTTVVVMSDHGNGGNSDTAVYLNHWLAKQDWLYFNRLNGVVKTGLETAKRTGLKVLPPAVKRLIYRFTPIPEAVESWVRFASLDWTRTLAYSEETPYYPSIWINLKGREPSGVVLPQDYDSLRDTIRDRLMQWRNPYTGDAIVKRVWKREELYSGPYTEQAPDLTIEWHLNQGYSYLFRTSTGRGHQPVRKLRPQEMGQVKSGDHRDEGILLASGARLSPPTDIKDAYIIDLAPTLLYLLGLPIPTEMDGSVLRDLIAEEFLDAYPIQYTESASPSTVSAGGRQSYSEEEEAALRDRLRGLGYIE